MKYSPKVHIFNYLAMIIQYILSHQEALIWEIFLHRTSIRDPYWTGLSFNISGTSVWRNGQLQAIFRCFDEIKNRLSCMGSCSVAQLHLVPQNNSLRLRCALKGYYHQDTYDLTKQNQRQQAEVIQWVNNRFCRANRWRRSKYTV